MAVQDKVHKVLYENFALITFGVFCVWLLFWATGMGICSTMFVIGYIVYSAIVFKSRKE